MKEIPYSECFDTGIDVIDQDHRALFKIVNKLLDNDVRKDLQKTIEVINELKEKSAAHFADEEALMFKLDYWGASSHRDEHRRLMARFNDYVARLHAHEHTWHAGTLALFMSDWLLHHVNGPDHAFGVWHAKTIQAQKKMSAHQVPGMV